MPNTVQVLHQSRGMGLGLSLSLCRVLSLPSHSHRTGQWDKWESDTVPKSGITIPASGRVYPDTALTGLRSERDFWGLVLIRIAGDGTTGTEPAEHGFGSPKTEVCTGNSEPACLQPQTKHQPLLLPEQSLAEVRAAPAPAQIPGRQLSSNCQGSRELGWAGKSKSSS